jgi:hypothetical protein
MITVGKHTGTNPFYNMGIYICDYESDVADLPTDKSAGSTATVVATGNVYILNSYGVWVLQPKTSSSSGDSTLPDSGTTIRYDGGVIS